MTANIEVRPAILADAPALVVLLDQLGYPDANAFIDRGCGSCWRIRTRW
jgi:hypothetical protein